MSKNKTQIVQDGFVIILSIFFAFFIIKIGLVQWLVGSLGGMEYLGIFVAGIFFTSVFTTAPAIVVLAGFLQHHNPILVALLGGFGSTVGDYIIFRFVKDRISEDLKYLLRISGKKRIPHIFKTKLFHYFAPFLGAMVIASPLPDEIGVAIFGLSHTNNKFFIAVSFIANTVGILLIGYVVALVI